jgi:hypothetical protein
VEEAATPSSVHLLMVHGVGRHAPLSSLLNVYQAFRSNLQSDEAPSVREDLIPDWRVSEFEEDAALPYLKLTPRYPSLGGLQAVYLYEVNYAGLAGVVRGNQPLDLTTLFLGFDTAACVSRQRLTPAAVSPVGGNPAVLARCMQRLSTVFVAATVPVLGAPSLLLRNYTSTFISTFSRFFEDIATFALDKNGEQLVSAHIDRTVDNILASPQFTNSAGGGSELVIAAHSLGSVVAHNMVARHWARASPRIPRTLVTFGSPVGLIMWSWLFLDFPGMKFNVDQPLGDQYFCWAPVDNNGKARTAFQWINAVNCLDPIATAFPSAIVDMSATSAQVATGLCGGAIVHRFFGPDRWTATGRSHTEYLNDRKGFVEVLLRVARLREGDALDVPEARNAAAHWAVTRRRLLALRIALWGAAIAAATVYCAILGRALGDLRMLQFVPLFAFPPLTVGALTFFQRLFFGGPTKRIPDSRIAEMRWMDIASFPLRLRRLLGWLGGAATDVDPLAPGPGWLESSFALVVSFLPTLAAMAFPIVLAARLAGRTLDPASVLSVATIGGVAAFTVYLILCAACELVGAWRATLMGLK